MPDGRPLFTIITACYNAAATLEGALRSLQAQTYRDFEHIVIDGGSKDGTVDVIRRHESGLAVWISEPDKGIADAWNKGLARARGGIIGMLNADDLYDPRALESIAAALRPAERALTYGITRWFDSDPAAAGAADAQDFLPEKLEHGFGFLHTTCFVPKAVYDEVGGFDARYRIAIDTDFLLRCHFRGIGFRKADNVTFMRTGGLSARRRTQAYDEFLDQLGRHGYPRWKVRRAWLRFRLMKLLGARR
jgi:glycosyltransferase involved in cell wall biosynthesis